MMNSGWAVAAPVAGVVALLFAVFLRSRVAAHDSGSKRHERYVSRYTRRINGFSKQEYRSLAIFVVVVAVIIFIAGYFTPAEAMRPETAIAFILGAVTSALAGFIGMTTATMANVRTTQAAKKWNCKCPDVAFSGGSVMGMTVVGLGLVGLGIVYFLFGNPNDPASFES